MTEQFALEEARGDRRAIYSYESPALARTSIVDCLCDELFARSGFSQDKNRGIGRSDNFHFIKHGSKRSAAADDVLELILRTHGFLQVERFFVVPAILPPPEAGEMAGDVCSVRSATLCVICFIRDEHRRHLFFPIHLRGTRSD